MILFRRTLVALFLLVLVVWLSGTNKVFSLKDDIRDFSLENDVSEPQLDSNENMNAYFGDLHVHTRYSFDAYIFGTKATPDDAYKYAKGDIIKHPL